uniref:Uncharacterized protein n=2 Tax=Phytophthora fragariae TaxID=53985 RepID=A0A6A3E6P9_9STRA|nr:hypothetical protein PF009_g20476 [Phytophthora fragariae]
MITHWFLHMFFFLLDLHIRWLGCSYPRRICPMRITARRAGRSTIILTKRTISARLPLLFILISSALLLRLLRTIRLEMLLTAANVALTSLLCPASAALLLATSVQIYTSFAISTLLSASFFTLLASKLLLSGSSSDD